MAISSKGVSSSNVIYLAIHDSPRTLLLPKKLGIKKIQAPIKTNFYKSLNIRVVKRLLNFYKTIDRKSTLIVEYDGNLVIVLALIITNIVHRKTFKVFLDCHVNSYVDTNLKSFKSFLKLSIILVLRTIFKFRIIVHNTESKKLIKKSIYCPSPFPKLNNCIKHKVSNKKKIFIISSLNKDEPINEFIDAAKTLSLNGIDVSISGNFNKLSNDYVDKGGDFFTGFLSKDEYIEKINDSSLVIAMTKRSYNLLFAPREALLYRRKCLINNSKENKNFYGSLCFYSDIDAKSISDNALMILDDETFIIDQTKIDELYGNIELQITELQKCFSIS